PVTEQPVRYEVIDGVAWLTINRPETRNALNKAVRDGLFAGGTRFNAAAGNGLALGGGFLLAQMCDLCVAAQSARFAITEVKVGRGTPWAAPLPWLIPPRAAMEILLTGDLIDADRAGRIGLVNP